MLSGVVLCGLVRLHKWLHTRCGALARNRAILPVIAQICLLLPPELPSWCRATNAMTFARFGFVGVTALSRLSRPDAIGCRQDSDFNPFFAFGAVAVGLNRLAITQMVKPITAVRPIGTTCP